MAQFLPISLSSLPSFFPFPPWAEPGYGTTRVLMVRLTSPLSFGHRQFHDLKTNKNNYLSKCSGKRKQTKPSNLQLQLAKTAPHHRHSRRRTEPYFNLRNNLLLTQALALALVGEKLSKAEYKPPYSTSNTQERENNECNRVSRIG
uniref:Uncharacterized protein n=1 Tax=Oryza brachyantha TaxID=4533 RepID=J3KUJ2_ORYBR